MWALHWIWMGHYSRNMQKNKDLQWHWGRRLFWEHSSPRTSPARITSISLKTFPMIHIGLGMMGNVWKKRWGDLIRKMLAAGADNIFHWSPHFVFQNAQPFVQDSFSLIRWCPAHTLEMFLPVLYGCWRFVVITSRSYNMPNSCVSVPNLHICFSLEEWLANFVITKSSWCIL